MTINMSISTKPLLAILLLLPLVADLSHAGFIDDKGDWSSMSRSQQTGYVIAAMDSFYYSIGDDTAEELEKEAVRPCLVGMSSDDFINIVNMRYEDLQNYRKPPWSHLRAGLKEVCNVEGQ